MGVCIYRMSILRHQILSLITFYQKHISPVKGFRCAYGHLHQNGTCSSRIKKIVRHSSFRDMPSHISIQFKACALANKVIANDRPNRKDTEECNDKLWDACNTACCLLSV